MPVWGRGVLASCSGFNGNMRKGLRHARKLPLHAFKESHEGVVNVYSAGNPRPRKTPLSREFGDNFGFVTRPARCFTLWCKLYFAAGNLSPCFLYLLLPFFLSLPQGICFLHSRPERPEKQISFGNDRKKGNGRKKGEQI
jgi:hypothetical protein